MKTRRSCELCEGEASVYCDADSAFLCRPCDRRVHAANFIVSRHVRRASCSACGALDDPSLSFSGAGYEPSESDPICRSCDRDLMVSSPSTSASSCVSSAGSGSSPMASRRSAAARVMEGWGRAVGLGRVRRCADAATRVMGACAGEMGALPLRAAMAAALWYAAVRVCRIRTCEGILRRLERCSGVPAKVIVSFESRIARTVGRRREVVEEGWGECS